MKETKGQTMANQWLSEGYAKGGFTEEVIRQLLTEVSELQQAKRVPDHHTLLRTCATLYNKDKVTEWWTVKDEAKFYEIRWSIPFVTMFCHNNEGGIVVYLDQPQVPQPLTQTQMYYALQVIDLDPKISAWLAENDPKALEQIRAAIKEACKVQGLGAAIEEVYHHKL